jgi:ASC-1-like (ASCH) protein
MAKREHLRDIWFQHVAEGNKTVEGRLNKGKFNEGDKIIFFNNDGKECTVTVTSIVKYDTFVNMLTSEGLENVLPSVTTILDGVAVYREFYSEESEKIFGVVAVKLKLID